MYKRISVLFILLVLVFSVSCLKTMEYITCEVSFKIKSKYETRFQLYWDTGTGFDGSNARTFIVGNDFRTKNIKIKYYRKISGLRFDIGSTSGNEVVIEKLTMKTYDMDEKLSLVDKRFWNINNQISYFEIKDGKLIAKTNGLDPYIILKQQYINKYFNPRSVLTDDVPYIVLSGTSDTKGAGQIFWDVGLGFNEQQSFNYQIDNDNFSIKLPLPNIKSIENIRFDIIDKADATIGISSMLLMLPDKKPISLIDKKAWKVEQQIKEISFDEKYCTIKTSGSDPYLYLDWDYIKDRIKS